MKPVSPKEAPKVTMLHLADQNQPEKTHANQPISLSDKFCSLPYLSCGLAMLCNVNPWSIYAQSSSCYNILLHSIIGMLDMVVSSSPGAPVSNCDPCSISKRLLITFHVLLKHLCWVLAIIKKDQSQSAST